MSRRSAWLPAMAAALCLPLAVAVAVLTHRTSNDTSDGVARREALHAAPRIARDVLSYDYRTIDADIARARHDSTGAFARQYADTAPQLESTAVANHAIVQAQPHAPGIVSASPTQAVVLMFVDQVFVTQPASSATPTTRAEQSRVQMTLEKVDGQWRLASLSAL